MNRGWPGVKWGREAGHKDDRDREDRDRERGDRKEKKAGASRSKSEQEQFVTSEPSEPSSVFL